MGDNLSPINLGTGKSATHVVCGSGFTCALLAGSKSVKCWGRNEYGYLAIDEASGRLFLQSKTCTRCAPELVVRNGVKLTLANGRQQKWVSFRWGEITLLIGVILHHSMYNWFCMGPSCSILTFRKPMFRKPTKQPTGSEGMTAQPKVPYVMFDDGLFGQGF